MKPFLIAPFICLALALGASNSTLASDGTAVGVQPDALARLDSGDRVLQVGADVSVGELIVTGNSGQVQIVFNDETRLVVGPRSALLIETYLLASPTTAQKLTIDALAGSFRFITGNSPKRAYSITTPTASIAVRGTEFDLLVERSSTRVMLYEGALQLCNQAGACQDLIERCSVGTASRQGAQLYARNDPLRQPLGAGFRYAQFQGALLAAFRVTGAGGCVESSSSANSGSGGNAPPPTQVIPQTGQGGQN